MNDKTKQTPPDGKGRSRTGQARPVGESARKERGAVTLGDGLEQLKVSNTFAPPSPLPKKGDKNGDNGQ